MIHTYRPKSNNRCTVGHYTPNGEWVPMEEHPDRSAAAERVHWLNGRIHLARLSERTGRPSEKGITKRGEARLLHDIEHAQRDDATSDEIESDESKDVASNVEQDAPPEITCKHNGVKPIAAEPRSR